MFQSYFRSGWAFFIPYLAAYLLYAWLKWPVNPATGGEGIVKGISEGVGAVSATLSTVSPSTGPASLLPRSLIPSLLYVYWALHAIHLGLAAMALRIWWCAHNSGNRGLSTLSSQLSALWPLAPWLLLALVFYIPGIYLEWPSDPWEHLRRINEWSTQSQVRLHSTAFKSAYFLYYSFVSAFPAAWKLPVINLVSATLMLILISQFWRLAQDLGMTRRLAWAATLLWLLTFGNTAFSFFRYYGISSTVLSQIGVLALLRLAVQILSKHRPAISDVQVTSRLLAVFQPLALAGGLLLLVVLNHIQGVAIVSLSILGVLAWRLTSAKPSAIATLVAAIAIINLLAALLWPRSPTEAWLVMRGWISSARTFELYSLDSPAIRQAAKILGTFGVIDLVAAFCLLGRNRLIPWLTITPVIVLALPVTCLVLVAFLPSRAPELVTIFGRLLFAVPWGLSTVTLVSDLAQRVRLTHLPYSALLLVGIYILCGGAITPTNERAWHLLAVPAQDLQMAEIVQAANYLASPPPPASRVIAANEISFLLNAHYPGFFAFTERDLHAPPTRSFVDSYARLTSLSNSMRREPATSAPIIHPIEADAWVTVAGHAPQFPWGQRGTSEPPIVFQNRPGQMTQIFSREYFPVRPHDRYAIEFLLRLAGPREASAYLAVAWYDENFALLPANSQPFGTRLRGWVNGTYSYFGIVDRAPARNWTLFRQVCGEGELANLPSAAKYFRIGCILNTHSAPDAVIQVAVAGLVRLREHERIAPGVFPDAEQCVLFTRDPRALTSPYSQAAWLSGHWQPQAVAYTAGAEPELTERLLRFAIKHPLAIPTAPDTAPHLWYWQNFVQPGATNDRADSR